MLYCFDKNENLIREINSDSLVSPIQTESLNSLMILEFGVFVKDIDLMDDVDFVAHKDMENADRIQMYKVLSSTSEDTCVSYQAIHILFDELKSYGYIRDRRLNQVKASSALEVVLQGSRWKVGACDDSDLLTINFYDSSRLEALSKVINTWGLDLDFYLTFDGSKISGRYVSLVAHRGEDTGERFVYGSNALEVVAEVDKSEIYTRIIPRGRGEEKFDENGISKETFGRRIRIDDVVWSKSNKNPIDKPLGQEYLELEEATKRFGFSDGTPRTKVQVFDDIEKPEDLIKAGYDFLVSISRPLVQFKSKVFKKSRTSVGDIVRIIRKDLDIYYMTRIFKIRRNLLTKNVEVEFGDKLVKSRFEVEKSIKKDIETLKEEFEDRQENIVTSFNDKISKSMASAMFNQDGYNYELKKGNKYGLPAGYYSFDRDINDNPTKVIYVGAGTMAIANTKKSNGDWNFRTFGTGDGFVADLLVAGMIRGGKVRWNLEDGTFLIGDSVDKYTMYWDGSTLYLRNVDIDLSNNYQIGEINKQIEENTNNFNNSIVNLDDKLSGLSDSVDTRFIESAEDTDSKIGELSGSVDTKISNITGQIESIEQDFKVGQGEFESAINAQIGNLTSDVEINFKDVNEKIAGNVTGIANLSSQIKQTESSITQSVANQITAVNDKIAGVDKKIGSESASVKSYLQNNYSTTTQTNSKIASEVKSVKSYVDTQDSSTRSYISANYSTKTQTSEYFSQTVNKNGIISAINQSSEEVKIKASKINLDGDLHLRGVFEGGSLEGETSILTGNSLTFKNKNATNLIGKISSIRTGDTNEYNLTLHHKETANIVIGYQIGSSISPYVVFDFFKKTKLSDEIFSIVFNNMTYFKNGLFCNEMLAFTKDKRTKMAGEILVTGDNDFVIDHKPDSSLVISNQLNVYIRFGKNNWDESPIRVYEETEFYKPFKVGKINIGHWSIVYSDDQLQFHNNRSGKVFVIDSSHEATFWG